MGRTRNVWGPPTVYEVTLVSSSLNETKGEPCRVCNHPIWLGNPCLARHWHVGYAHIECGWFTPADLSYKAREAMHRVARGEELDHAQREVLFREGWAIRGPGELQWGARGALVYRQILDIVETEKDTVDTEDLEEAS
jgi:hypothetical protein